MSNILRSSALALAVCTASCGGSQGPGPVAAGPGAPSAPLAAPAADTNVPAPAELFAVARLEGPLALADLAVAWSGLPVDLRAELRREAPGIDEALDLGASVDFVAALDPASRLEPKVHWAFSFGARGVDAVRAFLERQGGARLAARPGGELAIEVDDLRCVAGRALGPSPVRVACSDGEPSLRALSPYLLRGLPLEAGEGPGVHARLRAAPLRARYGNQLTLLRTLGVPFVLREVSLGHAKFDASLRDALYGVADELILLATELDRVELHAGPAAGVDAVDVSTSVHLSGARSWFARGLARSAARADAPWEGFWRLPASAQEASFAGRGDVEAMKPVAHSVGALLDGLLDHAGAPPARRGAVVAALEKLLTADFKAASASLAPPARAAAAEDPREVLRAAVGEGVGLLDAGGDAALDLASELVKLSADRAFRARVAALLHVPEAELPRAAERAPRDLRGLPRGTRTFEVWLPEKAADKKGAGRGARAPAPLALVLVIAPDGLLTYVGYGVDEPRLLDAIRAAREGTAPTLAAREGLAPLRALRASSGGFVSLAGLLGRVPLGGTDLPARLAMTPGRGQTPMLWQAKASTAGPSLEARLRLPRAVAEDAAALAATSGR